MEWPKILGQKLKLWRLVVLEDSDGERNLRILRKIPRLQRNIPNLVGMAVRVVWDHYCLLEVDGTIHYKNDYVRRWYWYPLGVRVDNRSWSPTGRLTTDRNGITWQNLGPIEDFPPVSTPPAPPPNITRTEWLRQRYGTSRDRRAIEDLHPRNDALNTWIDTWIDKGQIPENYTWLDDPAEQKPKPKPKKDYNNDKRDIG